MATETEIEAVAEVIHRRFGMVASLPSCRIVAERIVDGLDRVRAEDTRDVAEMEFVAQRIEAGAETGGDYGRAWLNAARMVREALAGFSGGASAGDGD